jgi:hypothetical protein
MTSLLEKKKDSITNRRELSHIRTSLDYLNHLCIDVFAMIKQLGPPTFFMTFTTCVNNWLILIKTLKELYD